MGLNRNTKQAMIIVILFGAALFGVMLYDEFKPEIRIPEETQALLQPLGETVGWIFIMGLLSFFAVLILGDLIFGPPLDDLSNRSTLVLWLILWSIGMVLAVPKLTQSWSSFLSYRSIIGPAIEVCMSDLQKSDATADISKILIVDVGQSGNLLPQKKIHPLQLEIPDGQRATQLSDLTAVVCVETIRTTIQTCYYRSKGISVGEPIPADRVRLDKKLKLVDWKTKQILAERILLGTEPGRCPQEVESATTIQGSPAELSYDLLHEFIGSKSLR